MCPADLVHCCLGDAEILDFPFLLEFLKLSPGVFDRDGAIDLCGNHINNGYRSKRNGNVRGVGSKDQWNRLEDCSTTLRSTGARILAFQIHLRPPP
jgi:hypothetical protein